jgi:hypothetical protein
MDMIWLDCQRKNHPSLLFAFYLDKLLTAILELAYKNRLPSLGTPDEMIDNEVYAVLIPLVLKFTLVCRFHIYNIQYFRQLVKPNGLLAKAREKSAYPPGLKSQRLAAGSLSVMGVYKSCQGEEG